MDVIEVDGSLGEGGGQIMRTAVALSVISGSPVRVVNVRAGRDPPGLKRQHSSVLRILAQVFGGELSGATEGSSEVSFAPGKPKAGNLTFDMGTAASITLVLQAVIPAVALGGTALSIDLVGGTDVPWSPTFDYFEKVVRKGYAAVGIETEVSCASRGYYPRGGGRVTCKVGPCKSVAPLEMEAPSRAEAVRLVSRCAGLPRAVAERQARAASGVLSQAGLSVDAVVEDGRALSPGSSVLVYDTSGDRILGSDALGQRGKPAEAVGSEAAEKFVTLWKSGARVDSNLADMIVPLAAFAESQSTVRIPRATPHLESGLRLAEQFTGCSWSVRTEAGGDLVTVLPNNETRSPIRHNV